MPSRISIDERIEHAKERDENSLNLSFHFREIANMMGKLGINGTDGTDKLARAIAQQFVD